jgi:phenylacetate-CoA ligase
MDQYGCCEMGNIAVQKPNEDFLTINADYVHVDIVDQDDRIVNKTKELGDILITDLNTKECPLIKYRLGDRSRIYQSMEESNDGFPKMEFVKGRISDAIWLPDGTYVDGAYLTTICDNYSENIDSYQLIQHLDYSIEVKFIPKLENEKSMAAMDKIIDELRRLVNNKVNIKYDILENIPDFAGKRKFIISELSLEKVK